MAAGQPRDRPPPPVPNAGVKTPTPIVIPVQEIQKNVRLMNQLFTPKSLVAPLMGAKMLMGEMSRSLNILRRFSQTVQPILDFIGMFVGLVGDMLILALLPAIKTFFSNMGRDAKTFVTQIRAANGVGEKVADATANFFAAFGLNLADLAVAVASLISSILDAPGFMDVLLRVIALFALTIANVVLVVGTSILNGLTNALVGVSSAVDANPQAYANITDPALRENLKKLDTSVQGQFDKLGPNLLKFMESVVRFFFVGFPAAIKDAITFVWDFIKQLIGEVLDLYFPKIAAGFSHSGFFGIGGSKGFAQSWKDFGRGISSGIHGHWMYA